MGERKGEMVTNGVVRSTCAICFSGCGVLVHVQDGRVTKVEGDPDAPLNKGVLCPKGYASVEYLYHPDRLLHPLKRAGKRGEGRWEEISWDEALATIAKEMNRAKAEHGAESVIFNRGAAYGLQDNVLTRLANAFGSPNITSAAYVCHVPKVNASNITFGASLVPDYEHPPSCMVVWGCNPEATAIPTYVQINGALAKGAKLMVIDPRETTLARRADIWIKPRPGSDLALALGLIHVIINEGLFDSDFVGNWTVGFDELRTHVQEYSPDRVEKMTWVAKETIRDAAQFYTRNKPGVVQLGNALEQTRNSFQTQRAIYILESIAGNIGVPGSEIAWTNPALISRGSPTFTLQNNISMEKRARRFGAEYLAPFAMYALPQIIVKALLDKAPHRARVAYIQGGNFLTTWTNARETLDALKELDFIAVADMFLTPTAQLSDIVLPVATYLEFDCVSHSPGSFYLAQVQQKVAEPGECWSDSRILMELGRHLGFGADFWEDEYELADELLRPAGLTFEEFRKVRVISGVKHYRHFRADGFGTPSSKVELYSSKLKEWGFDALPTYRGPYAYLEPSADYPLLLTNSKPAVFRHSNLRQIKSLRAARPEPLTEMNSGTAAALGIRDGEWVCVETRIGRIKQKAYLTDSLDPRVVVIDHGWWYPEQGIDTLHGWAESNANLLTDNKPPYAPEMGTPTMRGIPCKVYAA
jgi:anaerobic selenocysteine-containing dehydrogenase